MLYTRVKPCCGFKWQWIFIYGSGNQKKWAIVYKLSISRNELSNKIIQGNVGSKMKTYFSFTRSYTGSQYIKSIKIKKHKAQRKMRNKNKSKQIWALWYTEQISEHIMESYGSTARIIIQWSSNTTKTRR